VQIDTKLFSSHTKHNVPCCIPLNFCTINLHVLIRLWVLLTANLNNLVPRTSLYLTQRNCVRLGSSSPRPRLTDYTCMFVLDQEAQGYHCYMITVSEIQISRRRERTLKFEMTGRNLSVSMHYTTSAACTLCLGYQHNKMFADRGRQRWG
jgi:hypothetical protein